MSVRYPVQQPKATKPGDTVKRITVFLFGFCFAAVCFAAVLEGEFGLGMLLAAPALIFICIALWGRRRSLRVAKEVIDITTIIP